MIKLCQKLYYQKNKLERDLLNKQYIKTYFGKLHRMYSSAQQRVLGQDKKRLHYKDLPICSRQEFYKFAKTSDYSRLYKDWIKSGCKLKLTPTIDRLDKIKGYTLDNIDIVTLSENVKRR